MRGRMRRYGINRLTIGALFVLLLGSLIAVGPAMRVAADVAVTISNFAFSPTPLTVPVGTKVVWTSQQAQVPHTVTSDSGMFDSGTLQTGASFSFTFTQAGTFAYHCTIHPNMHGMVVVTGGAAPAAAGSPATPASDATGAFANDAFQQLWSRTDANPGGRSYVWGPAPFRAALMEDYKDASGGKRTVQYFDKARMELGSNGTITAGLLSVELISGRQQNGDATFVQRDPAAVTVAGDPDNVFPTYADLAKFQTAEADNTGSGTPVAKMAGPGGASGTYAPASGDPLARTMGFDGATKHNIPKAFLDFRNAPELGGIQAIGLAITEPVWANVKVGGKTAPVLVQAFERRVLTYTPGNPPGFRVEYGNIGRAYYQWRYTQPSVVTPGGGAPPAPNMPPAAPAAPGSYQMPKTAEPPGEPTRPGY